MTTRRRRPPPAPPRGRSGRFGLLPPLAMGRTKILSLRGDGFAGAACRISVEVTQLRPDSDLLPQDAREHAARRRALEAREAPARVGAAARFRATRNEDAVAGRKAEQLALRCPPAAAGAPPHRRRHRYSSSAGAPSTSIGIP